jgi:ABC-type microcin C transport system duplicated ATPase subunit YejF
VIRYLCDYVIVMHEGTVADRGPTKVVLDPRRANAPVPVRELLEAAFIAPTSPLSPYHPNE